MDLELLPPCLFSFVLPLVYLLVLLVAKSFYCLGWVALFVGNSLEQMTEEAKLVARDNLDVCVLVTFI